MKNKRFSKSVLAAEVQKRIDKIQWIYKFDADNGTAQLEYKLNPSPHTKHFSLIDR